MKKTHQQQYKYEEFDQHISLFNCIPAGKGNSLILLRKIVDGIQNSHFDRNPSILVVGEAAPLFATATANTLCSIDIRTIEAKYLYGVQNQIEFFSDSLFNTIHIINNFEKANFAEPVIWQFLKNGVYKFGSYLSRPEIYIHVNGIIILTASDIKSISQPIIDAVGFKVEIESYTQAQLELVVHQRLKFCGIDYCGDEQVLKTIVEYGCGQLKYIIEFLKICILLAQTDGNNKLTLKIVERACKL